MNPSIAGLRKDYSSESLLESQIAPHPIQQFDKWWQQAIDSQVDEANAMTLATASNDGMPSARIVLLKGYNPEGFVFFTNYKSYKGLQLEENPKACLVFFWKELERQVRIVGLVKKAPPAISDDYFHSRPTGSQVGAIASPQSQVIESREWLDESYHKMEEQLKESSIER